MGNAGELLNNNAKLKLSTAITHPRTFWKTLPRRTLFSNEMKGHPQGRYLVKLAIILGYPTQYILRKLKARSLKAKAGYRVDPVAGYSKLDCSQLPNFSRIRDLCRDIFQARLPEFEVIAANQATGKDFLADFLYDEDLRDHPEIVDFALNDAFLSMSAQYLGGVPVLRRLTVFYSNNQNYEELIRSQLFHVDGDDIKQLKFFINLYDVNDEADGPFTLLPASLTDQFLDGYRKRHGELPKSNRYQDAEVFENFPESNLVKGIGPAGQGLVVDTSRCLHYGSRIAPGHSRLVLFLQYVSYHNIAECKLNTIDGSRFEKNSPQQLALMPRIAHPFAYYYTNPLLDANKTKSEH
jgi:hypothetical protein